VSRALRSNMEPEPALRQWRATSMLLIVGCGFALQRVRPLQLGILISAAMGEAAICSLHETSLASVVVTAVR